MSLFEYKALAKLTLAFCPPDKLIPFYPITVFIPSANCLMSSCKHEYLIAKSSCSLSNGRVVKMFSSMFRLIIHDFCGTNAKDPSMNISALDSGKAFISPRIEYKRLDFPLPMLPRMMVSFPFLIERLRFFSAVM